MWPLMAHDQVKLMPGEPSFRVDLVWLSRVWSVCVPFCQKSATQIGHKSLEIAVGSGNPIAFCFLVQNALELKW